MKMNNRLSCGLVVLCYYVNQAASVSICNNNWLCSAIQSQNSIGNLIIDSFAFDQNVELKGSEQPNTSFPDNELLLDTVRLDREHSNTRLADGEHLNNTDDHVDTRVVDTNGYSNHTDFSVTPDLTDNDDQSSDGIDFLYEIDC